jgi:hypothetical protein
MRTLLAWALLAILALPCLGAHDDPFPSDQPAPPPEANPVTIEVPRGGPVLITLSAYSLTSPIIRYRIRRAPHFGKVGIPKIVSADTAVVSYTPAAGAGPGWDSFVYAIQSDAGVSAPVEVQIKITDTDPHLITPGDLEFGQVLPGQTEERQLPVQNIGGGLAEGIVQVPAPWSVKGDPSYQLTGGAQETFTVVFQPTDVQTYTGDIEYTGNLERATDLNGECVAPIAITTGTVELVGAGAIRIGTIQILNRTGTAKALNAKAGPALDVDAAVNVPANSTGVIEVRAAGTAEINDTVTVTGEGFQQVVAIHAAPPPPPEEVVDDQAPAVVSTPPAGHASQRPANVADASEAANPAPADGMSDGGLPPMEQPDQDDDDSADVTLSWSLGIMDVTQSEAKLGCAFTGAKPASSYRLESESVKLDADGKPVPDWLPIDNVSVTSSGPLVAVDMRGLRPGAEYVIRLVGLDGQGNVIEASSVQQFITPGKDPWWTWQWGVLALVGAAGWYGWQKWKGRRRGW